MIVIKTIKFLFKSWKIVHTPKIIRTILKNGKEITDQKEANNELFNCYNDPFTNDKRKLKHDVAQILTLIQTPRITVE